MRLKKIMLAALLLLAIMTIGAASAADTDTIAGIDNATGDVVGAENDNQDVLEDSTEDITSSANDDEILGETAVDLSISLELNKLVYDVGDTIQITATAHNNGPDDATGTYATFTCPSLLNIKSANTLTGSYADGTWTIGNLASGETATLDLVCQVVNSGRAEFSTTITSVVSDLDAANNEDSLNIYPIETVVGSATDLIITTEANITGSCSVGDKIAVTVTAHNNGPDNATGTYATITCSPSLNILSANTLTGSFADWTWTIGNLTSGETAILNLVCQPITAGNSTVSTTINSAVYDLNASNNEDSLNIEAIPIVDLAITVGSDVTDYCSVGETVTITLTASNNGPCEASGATVTFIYPPSLIVKSSLPTSGNYTDGVWNITTLSPGSPATLVILCQAIAPANETLTAAIGSNETDANITDNIASTDISIREAGNTFADLRNLISITGEGEVLELTKDYNNNATVSGEGISISKAITIDGKGHTLDAEESSRIFKVEAANVTLKNIVFINGKYSSASGAAVYWSGNNGSVSNCRFTNNKAYGNDGGGIAFTSSANCSVSDSIFVSNYAGMGGGAIYAGFCANFNVTNCSFRANTAQYDGGTIICWGSDDGIISNCRFEDSSTGRDGGVIFWYDSDRSTVYNCSFINNNANSNGGAIHCYSGTEDASVINSTFINNTASTGGAIKWDGSNGKIDNSTFTRKDDDNNRVIYVSASNAIVSNSRFKAKTAESLNDVISGGTVVNCTLNEDEDSSVSSFKDLQILISATDEGGIIELDTDYINDGTTSSDGITISNAMTIDGKGHTLDANRTSRIFNIKAESVTLKNIIFKNGNETFGGAIYHEDLSVYGNEFNATISNCSFINCFAYQGGGLNWACNRAIVSECEFVNCSASGSGGGIYYGAYADGIVADSRFSNCSADDGGAINYLSNRGAVSNCDFTKCSANSGRIIALDGNNVLVSNCTLNGETMEKMVPEITATTHNVDYSEKAAVSVTLPIHATNNVNFILSKGDTFISNTTAPVTNGTASCEFEDLRIGTYNVRVEYGGDTNYMEASDNVKFTVRPKVVVSPIVPENTSATIFIDFGEDVTSTLFVMIDANPFEVVSISRGIVNETTRAVQYGPGNHTVTFAYIGNDLDKDVFSEYDLLSDSMKQLEYALQVIPVEIPLPDETTTDNLGSMVVGLAENTTGNFTIYVDGEKVDVIILNDFKESTQGNVAKIVDGILRIDLSQFGNGKHTILIVYSGNDEYQGFTKEINVTVNAKSPSITAGDMTALYSAGQSYTIKVYEDTGVPANRAAVSVNMNGKSFTIFTASNGVASFKVSQTPGTYRLTITSLGKSITRTLKVKHIVTLKSVTVKKSAKKLVLTATLAKVNKKYLKNKKITFKFNGKKYTAKTNKKGVAKVTVKSSVLKKLKVGKKVTYQATYLKDTVKKTVKVKK